MTPLFLVWVLLASFFEALVRLGPEVIFFGPVGVDIGRAWGQEAGRWASVWFAPHPELTLGLGVEEANGQVAPEIGLRWRPAGAPGWSIGFRAGRKGPSVSIGVRQ